MTETTKTTGSGGLRGWLLFDGGCPMCIGLARRFGFIIRHRRFDLVPLQTQWVRTHLGLAEGEQPTEIMVLSSGGTVVGGADAVIFLARHIWWALPLWVLSKVPGAMHLLRAAYRAIAHHRHRF